MLTPTADTEKTAIENTQQRGRPAPALHFDATGERFEFKTSARSEQGTFRFRWTLAPGKKGPPEHLHDDENETFAVVSGTLRIWIDAVPRDLGAGQSVVVARGVPHRFLNPTSEPAVIDVSLDGPKMEDALVPLAFRFEGRRKMTPAELLVMLVHTEAVNPSRSPSRLIAGLMNGMARLFRLFGVKPLPLVESWQEQL